ncbi:MAG: lytic murein transglycosylase [Pseudomonadota bacterium]
MRRLMGGLKTARFFAIASLTATAACAGTPPPTAVAERSPPAAAAEAPQSFEDWLAGFRAKARADGISAATVEAALTGLEPDPGVLKSNDYQPEFTRTLWDYLEIAVSDQRVANGRAKLAEHRAALEAVERDYGVDAEVIVAIWGLETSYGEIMGTKDIFRSLATLGHEGRRTKFGRQQLMGALTIVDKGYARRDEMQGSWAGAMGHTQFIPTTYLAYAVDRNGDGRRDIWTTLPDVFASTANYLAKSGYEKDAPWGYEVTLPDGFDYALTSRSVKKPVIEWYAAGVSRPDGAPVTQGVDANAAASILTPAGARGPAFLVLQNHRAIFAYNPATAYAMGIGLLSDAIAGRDISLAQGWPLEDKALSLSQRKALQEALNARGFNVGAVDGIIGARTVEAIRNWQRSIGATADGYASVALLEKLLAS